ncbi:hypothetical protein SAMN04488002_1876 [Litoreibacter janthinus]|uniref:Uncharacterized protein n=2 Tax=Litoreibacter janthinus TaxID=670154 RepID=A0A1I6GR39_9RHOB|nr:hypothetical protein SAMN04488002_1876 [Litoreibacter janthinus]
MPDKQGRMAERDLLLLRRALIGILVAAALVAGVFGFRAVASFIYWNDQAHQFEPIAGWMTPRYVARSWQVPPEVVSNALELPLAGGQGRISLDEISQARGADLEAIIMSLHDAISAHKAERQ